MIIDHKRKFIFVAVPKTASTTIHKLLNVLENKTDPYLQEKYHYPITSILKESPDVIDYFKFGFCRNPWDRLYSSWLEFTQRKDHLTTWSSELPKEFSNFEDFVLGFEKSQWSKEIHFQPSSWYLYDKDKPLDYIGRYENFSDELKVIFKTLKIKNIDWGNLPHTRKTKRDEDYRLYYNKKTAEIVEYFYKDDIINFGYKFQ